MKQVRGLQKGLRTADRMGKGRTTESSSFLSSLVLCEMQMNENPQNLKGLDKQRLVCSSLVVKPQMGSGGWRALSPGMM